MYTFRERMGRTSEGPGVAFAKIFSQALDVNFQKLSIYSLEDVEKINEHL